MTCLLSLTGAVAGLVLTTLLVEVLNILDTLLVILLVHGLLRASLRLGGCLELRHWLGAAEVVVGYANGIGGLHAIFETSTTIHQLVEPAMRCGAHQLLLGHLVLVHVFIARFLEGVVGLHIGVLLITLLLFVCCLVLWQLREVQRRDDYPVNVLELGSLLDVEVVLHVFITII